MLALARFLAILATGLVTAATIGKLVPHIPWLATAFEGGRHQRRVDQISEIERSRP